MRDFYVAQGVFANLVGTEEGAGTGDGRNWIITQLYTEPAARQQGRASALLRRVLQDADRDGVTLRLSVHPDPPEGWPRMDVGQLRAWYQRHGFTPHPDDQNTMIREPQS